MKWILLKKLSESTGYSEAALRQKIQRGEWVCGIHFIYSPDGRIQFSTEAYDKWVEGTKPGYLLGAKKA